MRGYPRRVNDTVAVAANVRISNAWLLRDREGRRFLIDTGHRVERWALERHLARAGVRGPGDLSAVLLTHRHSDHAGNARWARERFRCPVVCHAEDAPLLSGERAPARLAGRGAFALHDALCRVEDRFPARSPVDEVFDGGDVRWGFVAIPVPGHTEGSTLLFHVPSGTLFSGDAILAGVPAQRVHTSLRLAVPEYSLDVDRCHRHVLEYLETAPPVRTLAAGHGPLVTRGVAARLATLARAARA